MPAIIKHTIGSVAAGYSLFAVTSCTMLVGSLIRGPFNLNGKPMIVPGCLEVVLLPACWAAGWALLTKHFTLSFRRVVCLAFLASLTASGLILQRQVGVDTVPGGAFLAFGAFAFVLFSLSVVFAAVGKAQGRELVGPPRGGAHPTVAWSAIALALALSVVADQFTRHRTASLRDLLHAIRSPQPQTRIRAGTIYYAVDSTNTQLKPLNGRMTVEPLRDAPNHWIGIVHPSSPDPFGFAGQIRVFVADPREGILVAFRDVMPMPLIPLDSSQTAAIAAVGLDQSVHDALTAQLRQLGSRRQQAGNAMNRPVLLKLP